MASSRTRDNKSVVLILSEEVLRHYNCKGCHKWFTIGGDAVIPTHCPSCGKRVLRIEEEKTWK